jgi:integrase
MVKFRAADNCIVMRSTKQKDLRLARKVADTWEEASRKARAGELTQAASVKLLNEVLERMGERIVSISIRDYFSEWLTRKTAHGKASSTVNRSQPVLTGFIHSIGQTRSAASLTSVKPLEIERFRDCELKDGKSASTADFGLKVPRAAFADAHRKGLIPANPAVGVQALGGATEEREPFTDDQIADIIAGADDQWRAMILFGVHAGLRLTDAADITWLNIDLTAQTLSYRAKKTSGRRQGKDKDTVVVLHPDLVSYCENLPMSDKPEAPLFPALHGQKSGSAGGLSNAFSRFMKRSGIRSPLGEAKKGKGRRFRALGFHSMRHSFISRLLSLDVLPDVRKELAGLTSDEAHRRYCHLDLATQARAIGKLASVISQAGTLHSSTKQPRR